MRRAVSVVGVMGMLLGVSSPMAQAVEWQMFDPSPYSQSVTPSVSVAPISPRIRTTRASVINSRVHSPTRAR